MKTLFMFPGQGSQYIGMAKDFYQEFASARIVFEEASDSSGLNLKKLCFDSDEETLKKTEITQPALLTSSIAIWKSLCERFPFDLQNSVFAGHSLGEYSALVAMGALPLASAAKIVHHRGLYMQNAVPAGLGGMSALVFKPKSDWAALSTELCAQVRDEFAKRGDKLSLMPANFNSPEQIVISGHKKALLRAKEMVEANDSWCVRKVVELPVSAPFHSSLMLPAQEKLLPELMAAPWKATSLQYIANTTAKAHTAENGSEIAMRLADQISMSVRWVGSVQFAISQNVLRAVEVGPKAVLQGLCARISFEEKKLETFGISTLEEMKTYESKYV